MPSQDELLMQITGNQLIFLMQVLEDSLEIQMGYDWRFKHKRDARKIFHVEFIKTLLNQENIDVQEVDLNKLLNRRKLD